jgi:hypothetical protein
MINTVLESPTAGSSSTLLTTMAVQIYSFKYLECPHHNFGNTDLFPVIKNLGKHLSNMLIIFFNAVPIFL